MTGRALMNTYSLEREVVSLFGRGVGAGAANLTGVKGLGITSITRTGTGLYTITLQNKWAGLLGANFTVIDPTGTLDWTVVVGGQGAVSGGTLAIKVFAGDGLGGAVALADLTTGETLLFELVVSNAKGGTPGDLAGYSETTLA